jgi:hypothetical protein
MVPDRRHCHLDADGFLYITDRKKELLKTSGGKLVAPQPIENKLKNNVLVAQAALVGDKHKFISALLSPNFAALEEWAKQPGMECKSRAELVADSRVIALYGEIVREVNGGLANFETLKRFRVVAEEWTQESGELTPSMKLKRRAITARYAAVIDELYADEATARGNRRGQPCRAADAWSTALNAAKEGRAPCADAEQAAEDDDRVDAERGLGASSRRRVRGSARGRIRPA